MERQWSSLERFQIVFFFAAEMNGAKQEDKRYIRELNCAGLLLRSSEVLHQLVSFKNLKHLYLPYNQYVLSISFPDSRRLPAVPTEITKLYCVETIDLSHNCISGIPEDLGGLLSSHKTDTQETFSIWPGLTYPTIPFLHFLWRYYSYPTSLFC
jgi:hypothetical protein